MVKGWKLVPGKGVESLELVDVKPAVVSQDQVRVELQAWSINARDIMVANGLSPMPVADLLTPLSDAAGIVTEVGEGVSEFEPGDKVVVTFNPAHLSGPYESRMAPYAYGETNQGLLQEEVILHQSTLVKLPDEFSLRQAACLPCVGVTSWNAMFEIGELKPGQTVMSTGTGNLSLMALKLAKACGVRFGISSSDDEKLAMAKDMGADFGINYRSESDWPMAVLEATEGRGADVVLENVGPPSIANSVRAAAENGLVAQIGFKHPEGPGINVLDLMIKGVSVQPVMVGSKSMLQNLVAAVIANTVQFKVHEVFGFGEAKSAFECMVAGETSGRIVVARA